MADPEASQEHQGQVVALLEAGHTIGQSFVSRRAGLNQITVWLSASPESGTLSSVLSAELYHAPGETLALRQVSVPFTISAAATPVTLAFDPLADPPDQVYFLRLEVQSGAIQVLGRAEDIYPGGAAYQEGVDQPFDLAFTTSYAYTWPNFFSDLISFTRSGWLALPLGLILLLPGWLLIRFLHPSSQSDLGERIALSIGLSLALTPLLMTWTTTLGLHWTRPSLWFALGLLCAVAFYSTLRTSHFALRTSHSAPPTPHGPETPDTGTLDTVTLTSHPAPRTFSFLIIVFMITLSTRLIMVRDLAAPPWVDSVHHGVLARLILEQGALPSSYAPFIDIDTASYHPGFHTVLAAFTWLSGLQISSAMLVLGQVLNALIVFPVYLLTKRLTGLPLASVCAALLAGLFTPMPAYYTSWGRYTQLASLLILPAAFVLVQDLGQVFRRGGQQPLRRWKDIRLLLIAALACAGLFLTHYRVAAFLACLLVADFVLHAFSRRMNGATPRPLHSFTALLSVGVLAVLLALPWLPAAFSTLFIPKLDAWRGGNPEFFGGIAASYLTTAWGWPAMILAGLGLLWGVLRRKIFPYLLILWCMLMFLLANLEPLGFPGGGFVTNLSVAITLFMPISVAGGYLLGDLLTWLEARVPYGKISLFRLGWGSALLLVALLASRQLLPILRPLTFLARQADLPAIAWVAENIPEGETVLVNPAGWGYTFYQGQDGGYWIPPLAGRPTLPPPVLYGLDNDPARAESINHLSQQVISLASDPPALYRLLIDNDILYIYLGVRGGVLSPLLLSQSGFFYQLYSAQGVWIFKLAAPDT